MFSLSNFFVGPVTFIHSIAVFSMREEFLSPFSPSSLALLSRFAFPELSCLFPSLILKGFDIVIKSMGLVVVLKISGYIFLSSRTRAMPSMSQGKRLQFCMNPGVKDRQAFCPDRSPSRQPKIPRAHSKRWLRASLIFLLFCYIFSSLNHQDCF